MLRKLFGSFRTHQFVLALIVIHVVLCKKPRLNSRYVQAKQALEEMKARGHSQTLISGSIDTIPSFCWKKSRIGDIITYQFAEPLAGIPRLSITRDFWLGSGRVINALDRALIGMCVGEIREFIQPAFFGFNETKARTARHVYFRLLAIRPATEEAIVNLRSHWSSNVQWESPFEAAFTAADLNKDGVIGRSELIGHLVNEQLENSERGSDLPMSRDQAVTIAFGVCDELFNTADSNHDQMLDLTEFYNSQRLLWGPKPLRM